MTAKEAGCSALIRQAFWLELITVAWMILEAAAAVGAGIAAHSLALIAFGIDSRSTAVVEDRSRDGGALEGPKKTGGKCRGSK